ncbi:MAG: hypothetical protein E3J80_02465, partial [Hadesarchaea archaeon]
MGERSPRYRQARRTASPTELGQSKHFSDGINKRKRSVGERMASERRKRAGSRLSELSSREVEDFVVKLAKEGTPPSRIGIILR